MQVNRVTLWAIGVSGAALLLVGATATQVMRPLPVRPAGTSELAMGTFQCSQQPESAYGYAYLSIRGTNGIATPALQGQFSTGAGTPTPVSCQQLTEQVAADAVAGGCTAGPVATIVGQYDPDSTTVHFVCHGANDAVVETLARISRAFAAVTLSGPIF